MLNARRTRPRPLRKSNSTLKLLNTGGRWPIAPRKAVGKNRQCIAEIMTDSQQLILDRARKSRPGGEWSDDDYDVFDGEKHIGPSCRRTRHRKIAAVLVDHGAHPAKRT